MVNGVASGKSSSQRTDLGAANDGAQGQRHCEHGEVVADAGPRPGPERQELPAVDALGDLGPEPVGIERRGSLPQRRIPLDRIDGDRHHRALLHPVSVDVDVLHDQPARRRSRRAQPQRLVQHLHGVAEVGEVAGPELPVADGGGLGPHPLLHLGMTPELPQRVRQRRCAGVVSGGHERDEFVADLVIGQTAAGHGILRLDERAHQRSVAGRVRLDRAQHLCGHVPQHGARRTCPHARRRRHPTGKAHRRHPTVGDVFQHHPQWLADPIGLGVEVEPEYRTAEGTQRQLAALGVEIDFRPGLPTLGDGLCGVRHLAAIPLHPLLGEERLQPAPLRQPLVVHDVEEVGPDQAAHLAVDARPLQDGVRSPKDVMGALR